MATTKSNNVEFIAKNVKPFINWLKRFSLIDKSLLLEVDGKTSSFIAKTYNEERSIVKMSSIPFDEAGLSIKSAYSHRIKMGIYNILHFSKILDQFNDDEFLFIIEYQELKNENEIEYVGEKILLSNKTLKMGIDCTSINIFKYISDDLFKTVIASTDTIGSFKLTKTNIEKINMLNNLDDPDEKCITFKINKKATVSGKTYEFVIGESKCEKESSISIFKDQYITLDIENYDVIFGSDRLIFNSTDSNTITVISCAENS
mgnify:CR=1 FL=1